MSGTPKCYRAASFSIPGPVDDLLPHVGFHTAAPASGQPRVGARRSRPTPEACRNAVPKLTSDSHNAPRPTLKTNRAERNPPSAG